MKIYLKIGLKITDETGEDPHTIDYLDTTIWYNGEIKMMVSKLFDKRVGLVKKGLMMNRFPQVDSCLSAQCKYGIVTSQCDRFMKACSLPKYFLRVAVDLRKLSQPKATKPNHWTSSSRDSCNRTDNKELFS